MSAEMTFWIYKEDVKIPIKQADALKVVLKASGATKVQILKNGAVNAKFDSSKKMELCNKNIIVPLSILFRSGDLRSSWSNPFVIRKRTLD
jgi:hypothetical protein